MQTHHVECLKMMFSLQIYLITFRMDRMFKQKNKQHVHGSIESITYSILLERVIA